ncbi:hypothetical protein MPDQ_003388 [Monascus purpureus]|uniref:Uncharacterized protein n=1 Tax=Monascus purpureus TaxID=5098 RepID=A0A507QLG7_MONPU|nr:hypothetical protein MPDQ_003388 [Monascus purpureus]
MSATLNGTYNSAPDTPSPVYPDRLIRPLPKRTIRSRLSLEAADSILYPLSPPSTRVFYGSSVEGGDSGNDSKVYVQQDIDSETQDHSPERDHHHPYENGVDFESGDEDGPVVVRRSAGFRGSSLSPAASGTYTAKYSDTIDRPETKLLVGPDGYDAFENTNNKKKRKIPTPANLSSHHSTLSHDFANMGLSISKSTPPATASDGNTTGTYHGTGSPASPAGSGISGSGRGRLARNIARHLSGRSPLSVHTQNNLVNGRTTGCRDQLISPPESTGLESPGKSDQGIISAAIANAAVHSSPSSGNGSLLEQQNTTPTKTQFTFTCESDSSKGMALQGQSPYAVQRQLQPHRPAVTSSTTAQPRRAVSTQATQTSPNMTTHAQAGSQQQQPQQQQPQGAEAGGTGRKKKRSPGSIYALAARQRKIQQQYTNLHRPPAPEDIWICEFCEYESIFGRPPEALIRQYEIKDRKERKRLAEKRRLLEKAKMKGRKGKKATKKAAAQQAAHHHHHQGCDRASGDHSSADAYGCMHEDDYLANEYDEEPIPISAPAPSLSSLKLSTSPGNQPKATTPAGGVNGVAGGGTSLPS